MWLMASCPASSRSRPFRSSREPPAKQTSQPMMGFMSLARLLVELDGPKEVPVVGHRHGRHVEGFHPFEQRVVLDGAVEQRVLRVKMQMDERLGHRLRPLNGYR